MTDERMVEIDRMRFTKNSQSANYAILAIVFDVLYFVKIYQSDVGSYYYNYLIGISIIYNLVFMLAAFLSSEGVKNYKKSYSYLLLALAVGQVVRIFILPRQAHNATVSSGGVELEVMSDGVYTLLVVYLVASAICLAASAVVNLRKCAALAELEKMQQAPTVSA